MKLNLIDGINIQIAGEAGRFQSLPIEVLIEISKSLQNLVQSIAEFDLDSPYQIDKNNFRIELSGFRGGSAIPEYRLTQRVAYTLSEEGVTEQRKFVSDRFGQLMAITFQGDYSKLKDVYPDNFRRNRMATALSSFTNSSGSSPMFIAEFNGTDKPETAVKIVPLKPKVLSGLVVDIQELKQTETGEDEFSVARYKYSVGSQGKKKRTLLDEIKDNNAAISFSFKEISYFGIVYHLNTELQCSLSKEDDYFVIENGILDIIGSGENLEYAKNSFAEEFDYIYKRYNELKESELTKRIRMARDFINMIVKEVE